MADVPPSDRVRTRLRTGLGCLFAAACLALFLSKAKNAAEKAAKVA